jgi:phospholipase/carboxylesterase
MTGNPHLASPPLLAGAPLESAAAAAVLAHGRGHGPDEIVDLVRRLDLPDVAYLIPQAADRSWYPERFIEPADANEPWLGHALDAYEATVQQALAGGVPLERVVVGGFSQGGCLTAEFVARRPRRYGGVALLTGGLIGTDDELTTPARGLEGVPVFVATSSLDSWVPLARVQETMRILRAAGADVTFSVEDDPEHHVSEDAVEGTRRLIAQVTSTAVRP